MNSRSANNYKAIAAPISVAMAILYRDGKFLMQLRDNIPNIFYPGVWGLFGGHIEPEETPEVALKRELTEEINYSVERLRKFYCYRDSEVVRHIFYAPLLVDLDSLELNEGWDLGLVSPQDIRRGRCYSKQARQERAIGSIHQKILLDFLVELEQNSIDSF